MWHIHKQSIYYTAVKRTDSTVQMNLTDIMLREKMNTNHILCDLFISIYMKFKYRQN